MVGLKAIGLHVAGDEGGDGRDIFGAIRDLFEDRSYRLYSSNTVARVL